MDALVNTEATKQAVEILQPEILKLIENAFKEGALNNQSLKSIIDSRMEKQRIAQARQDKRSKRANGTGDSTEGYKPANYNVAVSYKDSHFIWQEAVSPAVSLEKCLPDQLPKVFGNPKLAFQIHWLNALTLAEMSDAFPEILPLKNRRGWVKDHRPVAGHYLVSLNEDKKQANVFKQEWINHCFLMKDASLLAQMFINLHRLGKPMPKGYFPTNFEDGHKRELYICFRDGKILFFSSSKKRAKNGGVVGMILYKNEDWI